jgi:uncharacterized protein YxeA
MNDEITLRPFLLLKFLGVQIQEFHLSHKFHLGLIINSIIINFYLFSRGKVDKEEIFMHELKENRKIVKHMYQMYLMTSREGFSSNRKKSNLNCIINKSRERKLHVHMTSNRVVAHPNS